MISKEKSSEWIKKYTREYCLDMVEQNRNGMSVVEFLEQIELPFLRNEKQKSIEEGEGNWAVFNNHQIKIAEQIIQEFNKHNTSVSEMEQKKETRNYKPKAPVLGLFCRLINKIGIDKRDETESAPVYCERICGKFKLPYTDRVRQNYNVNETKKLIQELTEKVLPLIDNETKILIEKYLDNNQPPKQNLYA